MRKLILERKAELWTAQDAHSPKGQSLAMLFLEDGLTEVLVRVQVMPKWEKYNEWKEVRREIIVHFQLFFLTWDVQNMDDYLVVFLMQ